MIPRIPREGAIELHRITEATSITLATEALFAQSPAIGASNRVAAQASMTG
jgi:hypothetical protein